ncbi:hypothetical protein ACOSQ4_027182 [Xanthoceras sorbifolium]
MAPKRRPPHRIPVEEANKRDRTTQLEQQVTRLTEQIAVLMANQNTFHPLDSSSNGDEEGSDEESSEEDLVPQPRRGARVLEDSRRWESSMRTEIPEFQGNLSPEEFLNWLGVVEEILEFKNMLANARVALQLKLTRTRMEKSKITDWEKMTRKMRAEFLPHNFQRLMYQKLQNLHQGLQTVDEYTTEFYQLLVHNDIQETQDQLVSRYCGGLRLQIFEVVNLFDPITKTVTRRGGDGLLSSNSSGAAARSGTSSGHATSQATAGSSGIFARPVANLNQQPRTSSGLRCFSYGEVGHQQSECKKLSKKVMFAETNEGEDGDADMGAELQFDEEEEVQEDLVEGDVGPLLMVRPTFTTISDIKEQIVDERVEVLTELQFDEKVTRNNKGVTVKQGTTMVVRYVCLTPCADGNDWLRNNAFHSTCTILGKVCRFIVDGGSCENIVSADVVSKLGIKTEKHPKPYRLAWLQKGEEVTVWQRALISFSIGKHYKDQVWCDIVRMDACHLLLGRPWQYDHKVRHDGFKNTHTFLYENMSIVLLPSKPTDKPRATERSNLLSFSKFKLEIQKANTIYLLLSKEVTAQVEVPEAAAPLLAEFA